MAGRPRTGQYKPAHPEKYNGTYPIIYRSSWEQEFMQYCDNHPDVLQWASEPVSIPYRDPITGDQKIYIPDFLVTFVNNQRTTLTRLIEIKPLHEARPNHARNGVDAGLVMRNQAKWQAARAWAMRRGIEFIEMTEAEMFRGHSLREGRANPVAPTIKTQVKDNQAKAKATRKKKQFKPKALNNTRRTKNSSRRTPKIKRVRRVKKV